LLIGVVDALQVRIPEGFSVLTRCDGGPMTIFPELIAKALSAAAALE
jgi:hypothetical protein